MPSPQYSASSKAAVPLDYLRSLRARAETLSEYMVDDLNPFKHEDGYTFLRTPDSKPITGDVNVTTTCSCVMALALTYRFRDFYRPNADRAAGEILTKLIRAPWMSSGLILNNAFTTTLVLRTLGFLKQHNLLVEGVPELKKRWDYSFAVGDAKK